MRGKPQKNPSTKPTSAPKKAEPQPNQKPAKSSGKKPKSKAQKPITKSSTKKADAKEKQSKATKEENNKTTTECKTPLITIPKYNVDVFEWPTSATNDIFSALLDEEKLCDLSDAAFVLYYSQQNVFDQLGEEFGNKTTTNIINSEIRNIMNKTLAKDNSDDSKNKNKENETSRNRLQNIDDGLCLATSVDPKKSPLDFIIKLNDIFNLGYAISEDGDAEIAIKNKVKTFSLCDSQVNLNNTKIIFHCVNGKMAKYPECISGEYKIIDGFDAALPLNYRVIWAIFKDHSIARTNNSDLYIFKQGKISKIESVDLDDAEIIAYGPVF